MTQTDSLDVVSPTSQNAEGRIFIPVGIAVVFVCVMVVESHVKLLWGGEFMTFWVGQQKSLAGISWASGEGGDPAPLLTYFLNWWSTGLLGAGAFAIRLPSMVGMAAGLACLWTLLRRQFVPVYAAAGCLVVMATPVLDFGYDARSYGLVIGIGMAGVLMYSLASRARGAEQAGWMAGVALAVAAGVSGGRFSMLTLVLVPVGYGLVRLGVRRLERVGDRRVAAGVVALLLVCVLVRQAVCGYVLVQQRDAFMRLEHAVERTAAPGEQVLVSDSLMVMPLYWYGSPALRQQMVIPTRRRGGREPAQMGVWVWREGEFPVPTKSVTDLLKVPQERVIVASPDDWVADEVSQGSELAEVSTTVPWERLRGVSTPMGLPETRVWLGTPKSAP